MDQNSQHPILELNKEIGADLWSNVLETRDIDGPISLLDIQSLFKSIRCSTWASDALQMHRRFLQ